MRLGQCDVGRGRRRRLAETVGPAAALAALLWFRAAQPQKEEEVREEGKVLAGPAGIRFKENVKIGILYMLQTFQSNNLKNFYSFSSTPFDF